MTYFCYIECSALSVPHMEPLAAESLAGALSEASLLLRQHSSGYAARIFKNDVPQITLYRQIPQRKTGSAAVIQ